MYKFLPLAALALSLCLSPAADAHGPVVAGHCFSGSGFRSFNSGHGYAPFRSYSYGASFFPSSYPVTVGADLFPQAYPVPAASYYAPAQAPVYAPAQAPVYAPAQAPSYAPAPVQRIEIHVVADAPAPLPALAPAPAPASAPILAPAPAFTYTPAPAVLAQEIQSYTLQPQTLQYVQGLAPVQRAQFLGRYYGQAGVRIHERYCGPVTPGHQHFFTGRR